MRPILCLLVPIGEGLYPDNSLPGGQGGVPSHPIYMPPYPSQGPGFPTHPIAPGGSPYPDQGLPGGSGGYPSHPIYMPPYPSQGPGFPTHPIAPGGGYYPDNALPIPPEPTEPPTVEEGGKWVWTPIYGWLWKPEARPK
jgi:hypothetical protein